MLYRTNQKGFSVVEVLLVLVLVAMLGFTSWYVWHSKQAADKTNNQAAMDSNPVITNKTGNGSAVCSATVNKFQGTLHTSSTNIYSFCAPDGWHLLDLESAGDFLTADAAGLQYKVGSPAVFEKESGGKDGPFAFSMFVSAGNTTPAPGSGFVPYHVDGSVKAVNVTGTKYSYIWTAGDTAKQGQGPGGYIVGTHLYSYTFVSQKQKLSVEIDYNVAPGNTNQLSLMDKVASTFKFNQ